MSDRLKIASALADLAEATPGGFALGLHIGLRGPMFLFTTFPLKWLSYYTEQGLQLRDPAVAWSLTNSGYVQWRDLAAQDPAGVIALAREYGLTHGATLALVAGGSRTVVGVCRNDREYLDAELTRIGDVANALHMATLGRGSLPAELELDLTRMSIRLSQG
ncbi:MAG: autoinducer binding domain-containing protein [Pseudomonadota bacterium]